MEKKRIWRRAKHYEIKETILCPMDEFIFSDELLTSSDYLRYIFICSTTGQGEVSK